MLNLMHLYQMSVVQGKQHQGHLWSHLMGGSPNGLELEHQWESSPGWHKGHKPLGGSCCVSPTRSRWNCLEEELENCAPHSTFRGPSRGQMQRAAQGMPPSYPHKLHG